MKTQVVVQFDPERYETETDMRLAVITAFTRFVTAHLFELRYQLSLAGIVPVMAYDCVVEIGQDGQERANEDVSGTTLTLFTKE